MEDRLTFEAGLSFTIFFNFPVFQFFRAKTRNGRFLEELRYIDINPLLTVLLLQNETHQVQHQRRHCHQCLADF